MSLVPVPGRSVAVVPTLDDLRREPGLATSLPRPLVAQLYADVARLEADLRARLFAFSVDDASPPAPVGDRAVGLEEAARLLAMSTDSLYRKWRSLGIGYKDADGRVKFSLSSVQRYIRARAGR